MSRRARRFYEFGDYRIDPIERELQRNGETIPLTLKAFDLLLALVENRGRIIEKDKLLDAVWPDSFIAENNLVQQISILRQAFGDSRDAPRYIETISKRGYRFIAEVKETKEESDGFEIAAVDEIVDRAYASPDLKPQDPAVPKEKIEPIGGAVPLDSKFYILRPADAQFRAAIARRDSIVLIKGARQMGKTSLLARGLQQARETGAKVVLTDLQIYGRVDLESAEKFILTLGNLIEEQLDLDVTLRSVWDSNYSPNVNFEKFIRREALQKASASLVWGLDEVDRLFTCDFGSDIFSLFRSWHNMRSLDPMGLWGRLTLVIAYATEAQLFIKDPNQSPFNVGVQLQLDDFTIEQVEELNRRYNSPLRDGTELERFHDLVGGHPYLVRKGLYEMAHGMKLSEFVKRADRDDGPLGNHLRRILGSLAKDAAVCEAVKDILQSRPCPTSESFYRLRSAGVIAGDSARDARPRCGLYAKYLKRHLIN